MSKKKNRNKNRAQNNRAQNKNITADQAQNAGVDHAKQTDGEGRVSVIVPVYQVEAYLKRAVDSILNQTYRNLEVILVDDGSTDQCGIICDSYASNDDRVKVFHKENGGLSDARNMGLNLATGEYIAFVDSDDYIAPNFVETLLEEMKKEDADVAMCSYAVTKSTEYNENIFALDDKRHEADGDVEVCDRAQLLTNLYDANHRDATYFIVAWNKLYRASLWKDIRFPKGKIHEDEATTYKIYDIAKKGVYLHKPLYGYFSAPDSITRAKFSLKRLDWLDALDDRIAYFEERKIKCEGNESLNTLYTAQIGYAEHARADAAIRYYYPLKEELPEERAAAKRLKTYVKNQRKKEKRIGYRIFGMSAPLYRLLTNVGRDKKERLYQLAFVLLFAWLAFLCFYKLDVKYVDPWDEARHGINAYEMLKQDELIRNTYLYQTDYYNLKPPLSMWTIMLSMLLVGKSVFAMRLPSVLCYLLLAFVAGCFVRKRFGRMSSLLVLAFLSANTTPFLAHMVRAGDADSLYVLLFSLAMISMIQIRENHRKLYGCGFLFALAFLTKSFHAGIIVIIGLLFLLLTGEWKRIKFKEYLLFILSFALPISLWAGFRYMTDGTEFLREMWMRDVLGRSQSGFGSNEAGFTYYFSYFSGLMSQIVQIYSVAFVCILFCGILLLASEYKRRQEKVSAALGSILKNRAVIGFFLWITVPALAFSAVRTKLLWYQYPTVTALLIAGAIVLGVTIERRGIRIVWRGLALIAAVAIPLYYSAGLYVTIREYGINGNQTNDFQLLIRDASEKMKSGREDGRIRLCCAYRALESEDEENPIDTKWAQQDVFVSEIYGDYYCLDGGMNMILTDMMMDADPDISMVYLLFTTKEMSEMYQGIITETGLDEYGYELVPVASRGEYIAMQMKK